MAWIETVPNDQATGELAEFYQADLRDFGYVGNMNQALSLRPDILAAWKALVRALRHHLSLRRYELIQVVVSATLRCTY